MFYIYIYRRSFVLLTLCTTVMGRDAPQQAPRPITCSDLAVLKAVTETSPILRKWNEYFDSPILRNHAGHSPVVGRSCYATAKGAAAIDHFYIYFENICVKHKGWDYARCTLHGRTDVSG